MSHTTPFFVFLSIGLALVAFAIWREWRSLQRADFIRNFQLPPGLFRKLQARHPDLSFKDCQLVGKGLRQFFLAYLAGGLKPVSMPSQVVDDLWHEFILYTRQYEAFCKSAFGAFMHHTPAVVMGSDQSGNQGLRRCFYFACRDENINPAKPLRLPLLFAIDAKLNIPNGFRYVADCSSVRRQGDDGTMVYCGGDFASSSSDGGSDGFADVSGDGGSSDGGGGDGGGCGGGGCGS